ncbi:hypothetical protein [Candidatus Synechococcus spongiarum]|uniref:Protein containing transglutaminase-like domain,putative cysteine protease n=1 Tax=Candidatus Synechococcus spongiarum TaxID=431041 RepID=A0A164Y217_9SYNE|nr:hypothetical protein [Candidatus Synechococcus spongiarum]SAY38528.1 Protein containing transglutaminase-like domain,putative cysteine protease [Candidatus Synechococcus spongiarum]
MIRAWFSGCTDRLTIEATSLMLTYPPIAECIAPTDQLLPCAVSDRDRSLEGYTLGMDNTTMLRCNWPRRGW